MENVSTNMPGVSAPYTQTLQWNNVTYNSSQKFYSIWKSKWVDNLPLTTASEKTKYFTETYSGALRHMVEIKDDAWIWGKPVS